MEATVIGAGLAGVEAAWQLARRGFTVRLFEARPAWHSPAHKTDKLAELICSNSLKSEEEGHATALLKDELTSLGSLVMGSARKNRLPAGKALAVDREGFSEYITGKIEGHPKIELIREEVKDLSGGAIIATGPLTSPSFTAFLQQLLKHQNTNPSTPLPPPLPRRAGRAGTPTHDFLYFYDAIAPIIEADGIDMNVVFRASRYDVGSQKEGDYLNCPMDRDEYEAFIKQLLAAEKINPHDFDNLNCFEACMPIEVMAARHVDALRHGPMKPMGIINPKTGRMPYAVVQLRQDNKHATLFNMVGFQTRMAYKEQDRIFRLIPGLKDVKFACYGSMHRNTYINGPALLDEKLQLKSSENIHIAGQLTGVEGYLESASTGLYAGLAYANAGLRPPPQTTAIGALVNHVAHGDPKNYQPMKIMWGLFPLPDGCNSTSRGPKRDQKRRVLLDRARRDFAAWLRFF